MRIFLGLIVIGLLSVFPINASPAFADTTIICTETDSDGNCTKLEKIIIDKTETNGGINVAPPVTYCYECFENYPDGTCKKTRKVPC